MLCLLFCSLKPNESRGIEILLSSRTKLGFQPKSFNWRSNSEFGGSRSSTKMHEATIYDSHQQIRTQTPRIKGTSHARKTDENSSKKTWKSNKLRAENRRNHESFHSLEEQILYKRRKNLTYGARKWEAVQMDGLPRNPRANIYESPPGQAKDHTTHRT
jgi:hypothetical protein